jgi:hypothetical protein
MGKLVAVTNGLATGYLALVGEGHAVGVTLAIPVEGEGSEGTVHGVETAALGTTHGVPVVG